jgi:hypothetical protein
LQAVSKTPAALIAGAAIEALEGVAALGFGLYVGGEAIFGHPHDRSTAFAVAALMIGAAVAMGYVAKGLLQKLSWARSPAVLTQLFGLFIAYNLITSEQTPYGIVLGAASVAALALLLSPPVNHTLFPDEAKPDEATKD